MIQHHHFYRIALGALIFALGTFQSGCYDVPDGFGTGLTKDKSTQDASTDTGTDSGTDIDTSNERTDPNQWAEYAWSYHRLDGCFGELDYHLWEYDGEAEATILFLNGRTEYTDKYHHLINMFDRPWNIIMYDHYGHGRSEGVRTWAESYDTYYVCDMKKMVDEVAVPMGLPVVVVAHSMGSGVATRYAELHPGGVVAYALSSPMYHFSTGGVPPQVVLGIAEQEIEKGNTKEHFRPQPPIPPCLESFLTHDCEQYDKFSHDPLALIGDPTYGWLAATFYLNEDVMEDASKITENILIMQAGDEQVVINSEQDKLCDMVNERRAGQCALTVFPGDWHELYRELDRDKVMEATVEFVDAQLAALDDGADPETAADTETIADTDTGEVP